MTLYSWVRSASSSSSLSSPSAQLPRVRKMTSLPCSELFGITYSLIELKSSSAGSGRSAGRSGVGVCGCACGCACGRVCGSGVGVSVGVVSRVAAGDGSESGDAVRCGPLTDDDARARVRVRDTDRERDTDGDRRPSASDADDEISRSGTWCSTVGPRTGSNVAKNTPTICGRNDLRCCQLKGARLFPS